MADFFCGSGTTALVAARLDRRFIANDVTWRAVHTTKTRLVAEAKELFSISNLEGRKVETADLPSASFEVTQTGNVVSIEAGEDIDLDYWEVDPAWDGRVFSSAAQAVRPRRKGTIPLELMLPDSSKPSGSPGGYPRCARLVTTTGEQYQILF